MCGISGYILKKHRIHISNIITSLLTPIMQRGPDDEGICLISSKYKTFETYRTDRTVFALKDKLKHINSKEDIIEHDIAFIHTRYSIIDLSEKGHQPFVSSDGSVVGIFNGEIYNYLELREQLSKSGVRLRTLSDTEVLVEGYRIWGNKLWEKMNGFWAVVLYDVSTNSVILCRDRVGVAPLYYRQTDEGLFFSSMISPLVNIEEKSVSIDNDIICGFIKTGIKDHDHTTCYKQIKSLPPATIINLKDGHCKFTSNECVQYWSYPISALSEKDISFKEAVNRYREIFFDAVKIRLRADVKVCFELSGGLDSSSIVAAASVINNNKQITTYTVKVTGADEEPFARAMTKQFNLDYRVLSDLEDDFPDEYQIFSKIMEEPYDTPANYNHNRMLKKMKEQGTSVVLTGAGGDEVLAGYDTTFWPGAYKEMKSQGLKSYLRADWHEFVRRFITPDRVYQTLRHYIYDGFNCLYTYLYPHHSHKNNMHMSKTLTQVEKYQNGYKRLSYYEQRIYNFTVALLPYYLRSTDHYTMGIPVEHRFPFLDYRMVEFGLTLPVTYLFRNGWTKYILRKAMEDYLPRKIVWRRKKMGFPFAFGRYLGENKKHFKKIYTSLDELGLKLEGVGSYESLLASNPKLLWRILSTLIWLKDNRKYLKNKLSCTI